ncbi:MAG: 2OG-Fe(II) oxygenase [Deltaproteobacteria bacterium]|nr:2OG-Fe(II) oxygenase [Deltaproteobacteria bacterium]MDQ3296465.1 2OG-Fe(II) oxygenase [Myxococcota bacterium]
MSRSVIVVDRFAPEAPALRATFDDRFAEPRSTRADRFVWDYWHVPGQYTALRTPAWTYFPRRLYDAFHQRLVAWGRETLGCHDVSPPWLSLYVEGCRQELHGDLPHGPWAFVFSLTNWRRRAFRGGETLLVRDEVLDFWQDFASVRAVEERELIRRVEPQFARLVVFDPRIPHGVREVTGTHDPRAGRLVIHGWFVQPRPFIRGPLATRALASRIGDLTEQLGTWIGTLPIAGLASFAFDVDRRGTARNVALLSDTTRVPAADERARKRLVRRIGDAIATWRFGNQRAPSRVTLPLVFER